MRRASIELYSVGGRWVAHRPDEADHDCAEDSSAHGESDHPIAALRALLRAEG